jgi:hypothetical protein
LTEKLSGRFGENRPFQRSPGGPEAAMIKVLALAPITLDKRVSNV